MGQTVQLNNAIICYPHLYEKHGFGGSEAKYSAELLIEPNSENHQKMRNAMVTELNSLGKGHLVNSVHPPWRTGEEIDQNRMRKGIDGRTETQGKLSVMAKDGKYRPKVVAQDGVTPITEEQSDSIFGGCIVDALVNVYWISGENAGLYNGLLAIRLVDNVNVKPIGQNRDYTFEDVPGRTPQPLAPTPQNVGPAPVPQTPNEDEPSWM